MKQYVEVFQRERIDGKVLADMDDEMMVDLGISSKLHRMRLMKVSPQKKACSISLYITDTTITIYAIVLLVQMNKV